jgi:ATP diphosphatase
MVIFEKLLRLEKEANQFGFNWTKSEQIMAQIRSELDEIQIHLNDNNQENLKEEIGDLLHAAFSLCIFCHLNPSETLQFSVDKFERRFRKIKRLAKDKGLSTLKGCSFEENMSIWNEAKKLEK